MSRPIKSISNNDKIAYGIRLNPNLKTVAFATVMKVAATFLPIEIKCFISLARGVLSHPFAHFHIKHAFTLFLVINSMSQCNVCAHVWSPLVGRFGFPWSLSLDATSHPHWVSDIALLQMLPRASFALSGLPSSVCLV